LILLLDGRACIVTDRAERDKVHIVNHGIVRLRLDGGQSCFPDQFHKVDALVLTVIWRGKRSVGVRIGPLGRRRSGCGNSCEDGLSGVDIPIQSHNALLPWTRLGIRLAIVREIHFGFFAVAKVVDRCELRSGLGSCFREQQLGRGLPHAS
jgi:hypothetical protein